MTESLTFAAACFTLGITTATGVRLITLGDFPDWDGTGYTRQAISAWMDSHGGRQRLHPGLLFRNPIEAYTAGDDTNTYTDRSRQGNQPVRRPWTAYDTAIRRALSSPPPDTRAYFHR
ncbi:hypothetical protein BW10_02100 [Bifidobacterium sp. UTBIF-56]|nr:hypothetical protein BW07_05135 [Bifidobacterium sp. UTCIF-36]TPF91032.1 hypothetical protein BW10_02100 [Bifidobacterium sp. UTBIF-56]